MTNTIRGIRDSDCMLITGSNTAENHPVISYEMIRAVKKGASLIVVDPRAVPMTTHARLWLQPTPGTDVYIYLAMAHVILREGWIDAGFIAERTEGFAEIVEAVEAITPEVAALETGVPAEDIELAARLYALGERVNGQSIFEDGRGHSGIFYAMGITQRSNGTDLVLALANLAMLCGQVGKPSTGVNPLRGQANVQGACDVGGLPATLPGYVPVTDAAKRQDIASAWGAGDLPAVPGLTLVEMMHAAHDGRVRAMFCMGENPILSDPNITHVEEALRKLDLLVVQDIFFSDTAPLAHVILPAASWLEKDGTFTNTERRVQMLAPVLSSPGEARPDWQILCDLGVLLDKKLERNESSAWDFPSTASVMQEIAKVTPIYRGITHRRLGSEGLFWPCTSETHPGTPILHLNGFSRGKGKFHAIRGQTSAELPDADYPMILTTGRILYHFHTGTMTRRSEPLSWREPKGYAEVNEQDATRLGIRDGGPVLITSRRGQVRTQARVGKRVKPGVVFLSFHWREAPANLLTQDHTLDPVAKIPEYKVTAVRIEAPGKAKKKVAD